MSARSRLVVAALLLGAGLQLAWASGAVAGTLSSVSWSVSKPHPGDSGVRYTWAFGVPSGTLSSVALEVPAGTAGAPSVADVYGLPAGGTATLSGSSVIYTLPAATSVPGGSRILLAFDGMTNTPTAGSYTSTVTTRSGGSPVDSGTSPPVEINANTTAVTAVVARSTAFSTNTAALTVVKDPAVQSTTPDVMLTVRTNAAGYTLSVKATDLAHDANAAVIPPVSAGTEEPVGDAAFPLSGWGWSIGPPTVTGTLAPALPSGTWAGYTVGGQAAATVTGATNADTLVLRNRIRVDFRQPAGTYRGTVTYRVTPTY